MLRTFVLSITLFVCHFVLSCEATEGVVYLFIFASFFDQCLLCSLLTCPFTFTDISGFYKINLVFFVIWIITIPVNLLQMIWGYITSSVVYQSVCLFVCIFELEIFCIIMVFCHLESKLFGELVKGG